MTCNHTTTTRKLGGHDFVIERESDGYQRTEWLKGDPQGDALGVITTSRSSDWVVARAPDGEEQRRLAVKLMLSKEQAFRELHRWLANKALGRYISDGKSD